jgi:glycosyltransferase involved in cell wall biosynthesis
VSDWTLDLAVATPHQESSSTAIAKAAARSDQLGRLYTTLHTARWAPAARYVPGKLGEGLRRELGRRTFSGIPTERIETVASVSQLAQIAAIRLPLPHTVAARSLYAAKARFDQAVARRLRARSWDAVIATNASAERTLASARRGGAFAVLNFIDSHPMYQNRFLKEFWGLPDGHPELIAPRVQRRVERELELADLVLVPSRFVARQLASTGVPNAKIALRAYGVDLQTFTPAGAGAVQDRRRLLCLYVGQMSHRKGVRVLIDAARRLRDQPVDFQLVGHVVSPEVLDSLPENVRWQAPAVQTRVSELMRTADLFVLPSVEDAFGLVVAEAMACALPVIASDHAGASELITDGRDGMVASAGDVRALAAAIERLVESPDLRAEIGTSARRRVEQESGWSQYGEQVLDVVATQFAHR